MHWIHLFTAIIFEVAGTISMRMSEGFARLVPSVLMFVCYAISFVALAFALRKIEVSVSYAVWSGVGTALVTLFGIVYFRESVSVLKIISVALIIIGIVGLCFSDPLRDSPPA